MLPNFIIAGVQKCGTTYLDSLVRAHPQIFMIERNYKENSFFDDDRIYARGLDWYESLFVNAPAGKLVGQTAADCSYNVASPSRIKNVIPNAKLIFILRHPIERAYSHYWHQIKMGRECLDFEDAIKLEQKRIQSAYGAKKYPYLTRGRYKEQFENVNSFLGSKDVMYLPFENFVKDEIYFLNLVFDFLGVSRISSLKDLNYEKTKTNSAMIPSSKTVLKVCFYLQKIGLKRFGRYILNKNLKAERPPAMNQATRIRLEAEMQEDILFYNKVVKNYSKINL